MLHCIDDGPPPLWVWVVYVLDDHCIRTIHAGNGMPYCKCAKLGVSKTMRKSCDAHSFAFPVRKANVARQGSKTECHYLNDYRNNQYAMELISTSRCFRQPS